MGRSITAPRDYSADTLELALNVLAMEGGRPTRASELLAAQGIKIPKDTLQDWKKRHADRYSEIATELQDKRAERATAAAEDVLVACAALELEILEDIKTKRHELKPAELAAAGRNITTMKALNAEKIVNPGRNRPTHTSDARNVLEILKAINELLPNTPTTTAEELPEAEVIEPASIAQSHT